MHIFSAAHALIAFAVAHIVAILGGGGFLAAAVLPYTGTNISPKDDLAGSFGAYVDTDLAATSIIGGGAITQTHGTVIITDAGVGAYTLAAPVAGTPASGGNDGQRLRVIDGTGHAHTITCPAGKINTNHHLATCAGAIGDTIEFTAANGVWLSNPTNTSWVIS